MTVLLLYPFAWRSLLTVESAYGHPLVDPGVV